MQSGEAVERGSVQGRTGKGVHVDGYPAVRAVANRRRLRRRDDVGRTRSLLRREYTAQLLSNDTYFCEQIHCETLFVSWLS